MSSAHRRRNVLIFIAIVIILILLVLLVRGIVLRRREAARDRIEDSIEKLQSQGSQQQGGPSGGSAGSSGDGGQESQPSADQPDGQLAPAQSPPVNEGDAPVPVEDSPGFIEIISQTVTPYSSAPGAQRAFQVSVTGPVTSVTMSVSGPGGAFTLSLISSPDFNGQTNWSSEHAGPTMPGEYSYSTTAVSSDGHSVSAQGSVFIVE